MPTPQEQQEIEIIESLLSSFTLLLEETNAAITDYRKRLDEIAGLGEKKMDELEGKLEVLTKQFEEDVSQATLEDLRSRIKDS
jgi:hypothetical protein